MNTAAKLVTQSVPSSRLLQSEKDLYDAMVNYGIISTSSHKQSAKKEDKIENNSSVIDSILAAAEADESDTPDDLLGEDDDDLDAKEIITLNSKKNPLKITSMTWTTPLGFPIVQPYRQTEKATVLNFD